MDALELAPARAMRDELDAKSSAGSRLSAALTSGYLVEPSAWYLLVWVVPDTVLTGVGGTWYM